MTRRKYWRIIVQTAPHDWVHGEPTIHLAAHPEIRIELELGGQAYEASWLRPQDGPEAFLFSYAFWYRARFVDAFPVIQVKPELIIPLPHRRETGYAITSLQYHLARLVNLDTRTLDEYLQDAAISVVPTFGIDAAPWQRLRTFLGSWSHSLLRPSAS